MEIKLENLFLQEKLAEVRMLIEILYGIAAKEIKNTLESFSLFLKKIMKNMLTILFH